MKNYNVMIRESDGWSLSATIPSLKEAVLYAYEHSYGNKFKIVQIIDWEITEVKEK